jgi:hypothetical protein
MSEGDAPSPPRQSAWRRLTEPEMLIALSAMVIGVGALAASWSQIRIMREEQHATVWPNIMVANMWNRGDSAGFILVNSGVGPAIVRDIHARIDQQPVRTWNDVLAGLTGERSIGSFYQSSVSNRVIQAGQTVMMFAAYDGPVADALMTGRDRLDFDVCYCSIYEVCWTVGAAFRSGPVPEPLVVERCPAPGPDSWTE